MGVLYPPKNPKIDSKNFVINMETSQEIQNNSTEITCLSDYGYPKPLVSWIDEHGFRISENCATQGENFFETHTATCYTDTDKTDGVRYQTEVSLIPKLVPGQSQKFTCTIEYSTARNG